MCRDEHCFSPPQLDIPRSLESPTHHEHAADRLPLQRERGEEHATGRIHNGLDGAAAVAIVRIVLQIAQVVLAVGSAQEDGHSQRLLLCQDELNGRVERRVRLAAASIEKRVRQSSVSRALTAFWGERTTAPVSFEMYCHRCYREPALPDTRLYDATSPLTYLGQTSVRRICSGGPPSKLRVTCNR